ncbi:MAG: serine/threonine-protein kinase [Polyangiales bacterium]
MLQPGEEIGGYVLVARLAEDSASTLLLVRKKGEDGVSAHRAMRILTPAAASSAPHRNAFFQRARATLDVRVTGLAGPLDLGEHRGLPYVVTEYVHGVSVRQLFDGLFMTKRRLRPDVAAYVGLLIAQALDEAHDLPDEKGNPRRLIHGAITPHRVILSFDGTVRLVGFGVAKPRLANTEIDVVRPSRFGYTAPEVLRGEPADTRADVFSLAVVLWEALTMRRCFAATSEAATLELMSHPQVVPPGLLTPGVPTALDIAIMRALAPDPDQRPATMDDLAHVLRLACPGTRMLRSESMALLLSATITPELERAEVELPDEVAKLFARARPGVDASALDEMTVPLAEGAPKAFDDMPTRSPGSNRPPRASVPPPKVSAVAKSKLGEVRRASVAPGAPGSEAKSTPAAAPAWARGPVVPPGLGSRTAASVAVKPATKVGTPGPAKTAAVPAAAAKATPAASVVAKSAVAAPAAATAARTSGAAAAASTATAPRTTAGASTATATSTATAAAAQPAARISKAPPPPASGAKPVPAAAAKPLSSASAGRPALAVARIVPNKVAVPAAEAERMRKQSVPPALPAARAQAKAEVGSAPLEGAATNVSRTPSFRPSSPADLMAHAHEFFSDDDEETRVLDRDEEAPQTSFDLRSPVVPKAAPVPSLATPAEKPAVVVAPTFVATGSKADEHAWDNDEAPTSVVSAPAIAAAAALARAEAQPPSEEIRTEAMPLPPAMTPVPPEAASAVAPTAAETSSPVAAPTLPMGTVPGESQGIEGLFGDIGGGPTGSEALVLSPSSAVETVAHAAPPPASMEAPTSGSTSVAPEPKGGRKLAHAAFVLLMLVGLGVAVFFYVKAHAPEMGAPSAAPAPRPTTAPVTARPPAPAPAPATSAPAPAPAAAAAAPATPTPAPAEPAATAAPATATPAPAAAPAPAPTAAPAAAPATASASSAQPAPATASTAMQAAPATASTTMETTPAPSTTTMRTRRRPTVIDQAYF